MNPEEFIEKTIRGAAVESNDVIDRVIEQRTRDVIGRFKTGSYIDLDSIVAGAVERVEKESRIIGFFFKTGTARTFAQIEGVTTPTARRRLKASKYAKVQDKTKRPYIWALQNRG